MSISRRNRRQRDSTPDSAFLHEMRVHICRAVDAWKERWPSDSHCGGSPSDAHSQNGTARSIARRIERDTNSYPEPEAFLATDPYCEQEASRRKLQQAS